MPLYTASFLCALLLQIITKLRKENKVGKINFWMPRFFDIIILKYRVVKFMILGAFISLINFTCRPK